MGYIIGGGVSLVRPPGRPGSLDVFGPVTGLGSLYGGSWGPVPGAGTLGSAGFFLDCKGFPISESASTTEAR